MARIGDLPEEYQGGDNEECLGPEDLVNKEITITELELCDGVNGAYAKFTLEKQDKRLKTGGIFFKQIKKIQEAELLPVTGFVVPHNTGKANPYYALEDKLEG